MQVYWIVSFIQVSPGSSLLAQITLSDCTRDTSLPSRPQAATLNISITRPCRITVALVTELNRYRRDKFWSTNSIAAFWRLHFQSESSVFLENILSRRYSSERLPSNMAYPDDDQLTSQASENLIGQWHWETFRSFLTNICHKHFWNM